MIIVTIIRYDLQDNYCDGNDFEYDVCDEKDDYCMQ